jgi:hypothetical protein
MDILVGIVMLAVVIVFVGIALDAARRTVAPSNPPPHPFTPTGARLRFGA